MDLEKERPRIVTTPKVDRRGFLGRLSRLAGLGAAARLGVARAEALPQEIASLEPPVDMTEPEVEGVMAEAPLSPVEQLLAKTELVDAVYLGNNPVAELRTTPDSPFMISINPEVSEEERNKFAELVGKSGQHFNYDTLEFVVMTEDEYMNGPVSKDDRGSYYTYKGIDVRLGSFGSLYDEQSRKFVFRFGLSDQIKRFSSDPDFLGVAIYPNIGGLIGQVVAKGDIDFMAGNPVNSTLSKEVQNIVTSNYLSFSDK